MKEAISFLLNFIGRRDCNAGGRHCDVEQLAARLAHTQEVAGSSPAVATGREAENRITPLERHPLPGVFYNAKERR